MGERMKGTPVIIRRFKSHPRDLVAILPTIPSDWHGDQATFYTRIGQHGNCFTPGIIDATTPPAQSDGEAVDALLDELKGMGYDDLTVRLRYTYAMAIERRRVADTIRDIVREEAPEPIDNTKEDDHGS